MADVLAIAREAALVGGQAAAASVGNPGYLSWKGPRDALIGRSIEIQQAIVSTIQQAFPTHAILTEEGPEDEPMPVDADPLWIVDPICGSVNYLMADPHYAIGIAYREAGFWQVGVVYEPARNELYSAVRGARAELNGTPLRTEQFADGTEAIERAVVGIDWPATDAARRDMNLVTTVLSSQVLALRAYGSPALGICAVAAGRLHGYVSMGLKLWDVAPASVILQASGGVLTDGVGAAWAYSPDGTCIASNATIHGRLITALGPLYALRRASRERAPQL